jgi:hypothetical protein
MPFTAPGNLRQLIEFLEEVDAQHDWSITSWDVSVSAPYWPGVRDQMEPTDLRIDLRFGRNYPERKRKDRGENSNIGTVGPKAIDH